MTVSQLITKLQEFPPDYKVTDDWTDTIFDVGINREYPNRVMLYSSPELDNINTEVLNSIPWLESTFDNTPATKVDTMSERNNE